MRRHTAEWNQRGFVGYFPDDPQQTAQTQQDEGERRVEEPTPALHRDGKKNGVIDGYFLPTTTSARPSETSPKLVSKSADGHSLHLDLRHPTVDTTSR